MFGKRMQQLQKDLTPWSFKQESFTTRKSLSWALLPADIWRDGMGAEAPSVQQLCSQGSLGGLEGDTEASSMDALWAGTFDT